MSIVNVPIINSTLVNAELLEKRRQFIINDCELLRREFEICGVELSEDVLEMYKKALIVYNANVIWDEKPVTFRYSYVDSAGTIKFGQPKTFTVPIGIKSVDPITLSFLSLEEVKKIIADHLRCSLPLRAPQSGVVANKGSYGQTVYETQYAPIFDNKTGFMSPYSQIGYVEIEANFKAKYGSITTQYVDWYQPIMDTFVARSQVLSWFQNPTLAITSLIPAVKDLFTRNKYMSEGIPFNPLYDYETVHMAAFDWYFKKTTVKYYSGRAVTSVTPLAPKLARNIGNFDCAYFRRDLTSQPDYTQSPYTEIEKSDFLYSEEMKLKNQTDLQKTLTYNKYSSAQIADFESKNLINSDARKTMTYRNWMNKKGGSISLFINLFRIIAEAHCSVMTPINLFSIEFAKSFGRALAIQEYYNTSSGSGYKFKELYIFINDNFKVTYNRYGTSYSSTYPYDVMPMWNGLRVVSTGSSGDYASVNVQIPLDINQPFPYYKITNDLANKSHLVKTKALLGLQKLRNGFLFQDIERNFDATFVSFDDATLEQLETVASKQAAIYDILEDVKSGEIYTKAITTTTEKQPFNPYQPEYVTTTTYKDVVKTTEGEMPILHPETEEEIKWNHIHGELVIQSAFFYSRFEIAMRPMIEEYNQRTTSYIAKLVQEMSALTLTYSEEQARLLKEEQDRTKLEVTLEKLRSGIFINDNGVEYWRPLSADEKLEMDKMIAKIEKNLAQEEENKRIELENIKFQTLADEARIKENEAIQAAADAEAVKLNQQYQLEADQKVIAENEARQQAADERQLLLNKTIIEEDSQWKRDNIDNLKCPTIKELFALARSKNVTLTKAVIEWENAHPFYSYNTAVAIEVEHLWQNALNIEKNVAEVLVTAKINEMELTAALKELFPESVGAV